MRPWSWFWHFVVDAVAHHLGPVDHRTRRGL